MTNPIRGNVCLQYSMKYLGKYNVVVVDFLFVDQSGVSFTRGFLNK